MGEQVGAERALLDWVQRTDVAGVADPRFDRFHACHEWNGEQCRQRQRKQSHTALEARHEADTDPEHGRDGWCEALDVARVQARHRAEQHEPS